MVELGFERCLTDRLVRVSPFFRQEIPDLKVDRCCPEIG